MKRKQIFLVSGALAIIALGAIAWSLFGQQSTDLADAASVTSQPAETISKAEPHVLGNPSAKVTLIEYAAPRCPHCARFDMNVFPQVKSAYIDTGKVFYVFRVFPLSEDDGNAEKLASCLPKDQYFPFMDMLFRNQPKWDDEYGVMDVKGGLVQMARTAGMNEAQARACMADKKLDATINRTASDAQARYQVDSTPTLLVNGKVVHAPPGAEWSFQSLAPILDAAAKS